MLKINLKTALRALTNNKVYSFLNIFGLAIGIACAALIFLWVEYEVTFDNANLKKDRLYICRENEKYDTNISTHSSTPGVMGPAIKAEIPGIANVCRTSEGQTSLLFSVGNTSLYASGKYAESSIFSMFTLPFVQGNAASAFAQLRSVVITEKTAKKFFGDDKNVVGKSIKVGNTQDYVVSGVIKDIPGNSTLKFEWLIPFKLYYDQSPWLWKWSNYSLSTYVELKPGVNPEMVNKQLYNFVQQREPKAIGHTFLFAMNDWHLRDAFKDGKMTGGGQIEYIRLFTLIACIILLIACINFMNLATARSEKRAREVGVRKVLGAGKTSLALQFMSEAIFMALIAAVLAAIIVLLALPAFNILVNKQLSIGLDNPYHVMGLLFTALICGLIAGSYPSLYLSSFNPISILKGIKLKDSSASYIRKGLVVVQFSVSVILIICTVVVYQQIQHVKSRQLGFNKSNLIEMDLQGQMSANFDIIRQDLLNTGYVESAALSDHALIYGGNNTSGMTWEGKPAGSTVLISGRYVTPDFFETAGLKVLDGRNLAVADTGRPIRMVVTKSMEKLMGKGSAVGKTMHYEGDTTMATVVGVVNDYVYGNMYDKPDPVMFLITPYKNAAVMYLRINEHKNTAQTLATIQTIMKKHNPGYPFSYRFVDDQFNQMFLSEMLVSKLSRVFAALAIMISCLGLFGLAAYTAERRTKEIGIRKVLGASVGSVTALLSKDFLQLVIVSCAVAFPIAYWIMFNWLKSYQYHTTIQWQVFALSGITGICIALITISFQSIKAALANPVKSLRNE